MPRDGNLPKSARPAPPLPQHQPSREEIIIGQRNHLVAQLLDADVEKAVLANELKAARQRIAELEAQPAPIEPTDASAESV